MYKSYNKIIHILIAIIPVIISGLGGALMVHSGYDDSPGGTLLGLVLIIISLYLAVKNKAAAL